MFVLGFGQSKCFYTIKQCGFNGLTAENQSFKVIPLATNIGRHLFIFFFILGKWKLDASAFFQPLNNLFRLCFALIFDNLFFQIHLFVFWSIASLSDKFLISVFQCGGELHAVMAVSLFQSNFSQYIGKFSSFLTK